MKVDTNIVKDTVEKNKFKSEARMNRMEKRMKAFEEEREKQEKQSRKRKEILKSAGEDVTNAMGTEDLGAAGASEGCICNFSSILRAHIGGTRGSEGRGGGETYSEKLNNKNDTGAGAVEKLKFKSPWAQEMSQVSLVNQLKIATDAAARLEGQNKRISRKPAVPKKPLRLEDSLELQCQDNWPWDQGEDEWDGTVNKVERNREKKKIDREKIKAKIGKAARISKCTIGLGPIMNKSIYILITLQLTTERPRKWLLQSFLPST